MDEYGDLTRHRPHPRQSLGKPHIDLVNPGAKNSGTRSTKRADAALNESRVSSETRDRQRESES